MKNINHILKFVLLIFIGTQLSAQDIHFSQFYESPLLLNPAAAGSSPTDFRFVVNYKNQWKSIGTPYKTAAISYDQRFYLNKKKKGNHLGIGINLFNDKVGLSTLTTNQMNLNVAYHLFFSRFSSLSVGALGGYFQRSVDPYDLKWDRQYNGKNYDASRANGENIPYQSIAKFDVGAGILYQFYQKSIRTKFEIGGSMMHITKPKYSFYNSDPSLSYKYTGHMNLQFKGGEDLIIMPAALFTLQGKQMEITAGSNFRIMLSEETRDKVILNTFTLISSAIQFGAFYRVNDAVIFTAGMAYKRNMFFGLSYDLNVSKLNAASRRRGGLEFSFVCTSFSNAKTKGSRNDR